MENKTYYTGRENNNLQNNSAIENIISDITNLILRTINLKMQRIQKVFISNNLAPKIKDETLCNCFVEGGLKIVDINSKNASLQWP